jgi:hypothetical protein
MPSGRAIGIVRIAQQVVFQGNAGRLHGGVMPAKILSAQYHNRIAVAAVACLSVMSAWLAYMNTGLGDYSLSYWEAVGETECLSGVACEVAGSRQASAQTRPIDSRCALRDVVAYTFIEDHGAANDIPAGKLAEAGFAMADARRACDQGQVGDAFAIYDRILALSTVAGRAP